MSDHGCALLDDDPYYAESSGNTEDLPSIPTDSIRKKEEQSLKRLLYLIDTYAPHLRHSFVCSKPWWEQRWGSPEMHVSSTNQPTAFADLALT